LGKDKPLAKLIYKCDEILMTHKHLWLWFHYIDSREIES